MESIKVKVNILGHYITLHSEKKVRMNMCLIQNGYRDTAICMCSYNNIANGNKEREIKYAFINLTLI
jgi:hypothetical protein